MLSTLKSFSSSLDVEKLLKNSSFRRTIYIGLGGFGSSVIRRLKKEFSILPDDVLNGFAFLALDTHPQPMTDVLTPNEYVPLSIGVDPSDVVKNTFPEIFTWYRKLAGKWIARKITDGAGKVKLLGRFSLMFPPTHNSFWNKLNSAFNKVNTDHPHFSTTQPPQIYIITSLAGGTGAGCLIDVIATVNHLLTTKTSAEFTMQLIIATPEALEGIAPSVDYPDFYANTYATLKEIFHFILGNSERVRYGVSEIENTDINQGTMPKPIWLITGLNENGISRVSGFDNLANLVASYLTSEVMSPLESEGGQPNVLVNENPIYDNFDDKGMPKWFSSFGIIRTGMPRAETSALFAMKLLDKALSDELDAGEMDDMVDMWFSEQNLREAGADDLQAAIRSADPSNQIPEVHLETEVELEGVKHSELAKECRKLLKDKFKNVIKTKFTEHITRHSNIISDNISSDLSSNINQLYENQSIGKVISFLRKLEEKIKINKQALTEETNDAKKIFSELEEEVIRQISNVEAAAQSWFIFASGKIKTAISALDTAMEMYFRKQVDIWIMEAGLNIYDNLLSEVSSQISKWSNVMDLLTTRAAAVRQNINHLKVELNEMSDEKRSEQKNWYSLIDEMRANEIYDEYFGESEDGIAQRIRTMWRNKGLLTNTTLSDEEWIQKAVEDTRQDINEKLNALNFSKIVEKFYPEDIDRKKLFDRLSFLSSPQFPVNRSREQGGYTLYLLVAAHPSIRNSVVADVRKYIHCDGLGEAYYYDQLEITLFTVKHGYTLHSLKRIDSYQPYYDRLIQNYQEKVAKRQSVRPVHCWLNAEEWDEPIPTTEDEEIFKNFILGRAFSYLYPTATREDGKPDEKRNRAFIYNRGNNYFIYDDQRQIKIGVGLKKAVENFAQNPEFAETIRRQIDEKISVEGSAEIGRRISEEYLPIVIEEKEKAQRSRLSYSREDYGRAKLLEKFVKILQNFVKEIQGSAV